MLAKKIWLFSKPVLSGVLWKFRRAPILAIFVSYSNSKLKGYELKEAQNPYPPFFTPEKSALSLKNDYTW